MQLYIKITLIIIRLSIVTSSQKEVHIYRVKLNIQFSAAKTMEQNDQYDYFENTRPLSWMNKCFFEKVIRKYTKDPKAEVSQRSN
jgi:hypothetical protein